MKYGLIGKKLGHSFSAELHRRIGGYDYELKELREDELDPFFSERDFTAINVTIPYKQTVIPYLDDVDPLAASIGTVNTIVNRQGKLTGYNTDLGGITALIQRIGLDLNGKKVLILGTGGTANTARTAAQLLGAKEIRLVSRTGMHGALTYQEAYESHTDADVIINTTPVGMYPNPEGTPLALSPFPRLEGVVDAIYNPLRSRLVLEAQSRGIPAEGGLYMLVMQGILASMLFTGRDIPLETASQIYGDILREKRNIVLIGMPGSGKTTVGRIMAKKLGREFVDLDERVETMAGKPIREIFARDGETVFRELEAQAIKAVSDRTGLVIATGGGCVLRPENVTKLRQNGLLLLLDRPAEQLHPSAERPLADSVQKLRDLLRARAGIYGAAADQVIRAEENASKTADAVIRRHSEV